MLSEKRTMQRKYFTTVIAVLLVFLTAAFFTKTEAAEYTRESAPKKTGKILPSPEKRGVKVQEKTEPALGSFYDKSYAVIIGINNYEKWPGLEYAVNDARAMEKKLKSFGFETFTLLDQHANKNNILKMLGDDLPRKVNKNDRVIIFFAGHGQTEQIGDDSQMGYIIPVDGDKDNLFSTAISMDQVRVFSRRMKAKHVLYLIDSCYAGLGLTRSGSIPPQEKEYLQKITSRKAHHMLVAGGKGELAHEEGGHGVFTKYVLEALEGAADRDEKGFITFSDISSYVKPKVSRQTKNAQIPQYGNIDGEGEFVFVAAAPQAADFKPSVAAENERLKLEQEKQRLEQERALLAAQREQLEEQKRLAKEREKLEAERKAMEEERAKLNSGRATASYQPTEDVKRRRFDALQKSAAENLQGITIRIVHVARRKTDAQRASNILTGLGANVHMYETSDSGNSAYEGKLITKNGYENYSPLIINSLRNVENLTMDNGANQQGYFRDGQVFNLWIAR